MKSSRIKTVLSLAVVAMACFALTTSANAAIIQTDAIGFPSEIGPFATDDLLQTNLTSMTATAPAWGTKEGLADGAGDDAANKFGYGNASTYQFGNSLTFCTATFVLDDHFEIGEIRVTSGSADSIRKSQDWDVYTSSNGGGTWVLLRENNILIASKVNGEGATLTLTDTTGTLASNVNAIKFDMFKPVQDSYGPNIQEIDVFAAVPEPATMSLLAIGGLGVLLKRRRRRRS